MSGLPNDEPEIDVEALADAARAYLDAEDGKKETVVVTRANGVLLVQTELAPEVAHYLLHAAMHTVMADDIAVEVEEEYEEDEEE